MTIPLEIPDDIAASARLSADDLRIELALSLYASRRLSVGKARELAGLSLWQFRRLAATRGIPADLDVPDFDREVDTLKRLGLLLHFA